MFSIDGLVSGLDTTSIIEGLVSLQDAQVGRLNERKNEIVQQQTAFQGINARLLSFRSTMSRLNRTTNAVFDERTVSSSSESIITASAGSRAIEGSYSLQVNSLAKAHQIGSQGFSSTSSSITEGTIEFKLGDRPATEITIDSSNNTVSGLVAAINAQSDDIAAAIVHDQSTNSDRILLTSKYTGASNEITVTNNLAASSGNATLPDFSGPAIQEATNASIQLGSGPGAITAEYESNQIEGLIEKVTLDLHKAEPGQDVLITVQRDTESAETAIRDFVEAYNGLMTYIGDQTRYNPDTNEASPLLGNRSVSLIRNNLAAIVTEAVPGASANLNRLSQIGISIGATGQLSVNSTRLNNVLAGKVEGVDLQDAKQLFGLTGSSNSSGVDFLLGSSRTKASTSGPYQVDILQAAERGSITATNAIASSIVIDNTNNEFQISVNGTQSEVLQLTEGTYTQQELADHLEATINASTELGSRDVQVAIEGSSLEIASQTYGKNSTVSSLSGSALSVLGFNGSESGTGKDVAGSFIVDGVVETATGSGRLLIGDSDNENTGDLQLRITLDPSQVGTGIEAELSVSRGITSNLDAYFSDLLDPVRGNFATATEDFELRIESIDDSIDRVKAISDSKREYLIEQFTNLERVLSELQTTSSFLSSQLTSLRSANSR